VPFDPNDLDLGSGGPLVLPTQAGTYADEVIQSGKGGYPCDLFGSTYAVPIYLLNRDDMGKYNPSGDEDIEPSRVRFMVIGAVPRTGRVRRCNTFTTLERRMRPEAEII